MLYAFDAIMFLLYFIRNDEYTDDLLKQVTGACMRHQEPLLLTWIDLNLGMVK